MSAHQTMTLADGTVIDMLTGRPVRQAASIVLPAQHEAVAEVTRVRKRVHDLPEPPEKMNAVALVTMYHMFGLADVDIAYVSGLTEQQVSRIKELDAFRELTRVASQNLVENEAEDIRAIIAQHSRTALNTVVDVMGSDDIKARLVAAKDLLDRAGHRPADVVEHKHSIEGGLTIEYIKKDPANDTPALSVQYTEIEDADDADH